MFPGAGVAANGGTVSPGALAPGYGGMPGGQYVDPALLLNTLQQVMTIRAGAPSTTPAPAQREFVDGLTYLQREEAQTLASGASPVWDVGERPSTGILRDLKAQDEVADMDHVDQLMIDVVAMMFDYILDDDAIPDAMKALIGRLQIPVLKVAIIDKGVFARKLHPAKQLLNAMAEAAVGWDATLGRDDPFFPSYGRICSQGTGRLRRERRSVCRSLRRVRAVPRNGATPRGRGR